MIPYDTVFSEQPWIEHSIDWDGQTFFWFRPFPNSPTLFRAQFVEGSWRILNRLGEVVEASQEHQALLSAALLAYS